MNEQKMDEQTKLLGLIKNEVMVLDESLIQAKIEYADSDLDANDWQCKMDRKMKCKVLEGQITILNKLKQDLLTMFARQLATV